MTLPPYSPARLLGVLLALAPACNGSGNGEAATDAGTGATTAEPDTGTAATTADTDTGTTADLDPTRGPGGAAESAPGTSEGPRRAAESAGATSGGPRRAAEARRTPTSPPFVPRRTST